LPSRGFQPIAVISKKVDSSTASTPWGTSRSKASILPTSACTPWPLPLKTSDFGGDIQEHQATALRTQRLAISSPPSWLRFRHYRRAGAAC